MQIGWLIGGIITSLFAFAQFLQLLGLIGVGFSIPGIGITAGAIAFACVFFKNAFPKEQS